MADDDGRALVVLVKVFWRGGGGGLLVQSPLTQQDQEHCSWAASKNAFVGEVEGDWKEVRALQHPPEGAVLTKRETRKYVATGERTKVTQESVDNCGTDEEL